MSWFKIIYCTNSEVLGDQEVPQDTIDKYISMFEDVPIVPDNNFKTWNGGDGNGKYVYLHMKGWGPVDDRQEAAKAIKWMVESELDWPSSEALREALAALHEISEAYKADAKPNKWAWMMDYCKKQGIPAAQNWAWEKAKEAYEKEYE